MASSSERSAPSWVDLSADLGDVAPQQGFGGLACAGAGVADGEQLADLGQPQPEPLGAADEQQPVQVGLTPPAVVAVGAPRGRQQALPFVVLDRVGAHGGPGGELPDRQRLGDLACFSLRPR